MEKKYELKMSEHVVVITLLDRSFSTFVEALEDASTKKNSKKKIWMMQSVEKENEPLKIFIVFAF